MSNIFSDNPLLHPFTGPFQAPPFDRIHEVYFIPAIESLIREAEEKIDQIVDSPGEPTFENTIVPLEQNGERLGIVAGILFNLNHAETNEKLQQIAQEASQLLTAYSSRMLMNPALFARVDTLFTTHNPQPTTHNLPRAGHRAPQLAPRFCQERSQTG
jgi:peptidyl-dipeptidase Dcp